MTKKQDKILLNLWKEICLIRANHRCELCGKNDAKLDVHHIFGRRKKSTRYDPQNGIVLCSFRCHKYGKSSPHESPETFRRKLIERMGRIPYEALYQKSQRPVKYLDYDEIKKCLERELEGERT